MTDYSKLLNKNVQKLKPSGIRKFFDLLEGMEDAISLGVGEPDFVTPWHIRDAGIHSLEKGYTKYTRSFRHSNPPLHDSSSHNSGSQPCCRY